MKSVVKTVENANKQNKIDINDNKTQIYQIKDRLDNDENNDLDLINAKLKLLEDKFNDFIYENNSHL